MRCPPPAEDAIELTFPDPGAGLGAVEPLPGVPPDRSAVAPESGMGAPVLPGALLRGFVVPVPDIEFDGANVPVTSTR